MIIGGCRPCASFMEKWATSTVFPHFVFILICVDETKEQRRLVSRQFSNDLKLRNVINGYIVNDRDMPTW